MNGDNRIDVFISSTCRDLLDLRAVVREDLENHRMRVRVSEDAASGFYVEPIDDAMQVCLSNVEAAQAVVCIVDRRYGAVLKSGDYAGKSATEAEIIHARNHGKPVFFFVREATLSEFQAMEQNPNVKTNWIERGESKNLKLFWRGMETLPDHANSLTWFDTFRTAVDLKDTVRLRLIAKFPEYAGTLALAPDRFVRLTLLRDGNHPAGFKNLGIGPAFKVRFGIVPGNWPGTPIMFANMYGGENVAGIRDGETHHGAFPMGSQAPNSRVPCKVYCEYSNLYGDRYRIEIPAVTTPAVELTHEEEFYIMTGPKDNPKATRV